MTTSARLASAPWPDTCEQVGDDRRWGTRSLRDIEARRRELLDCLLQSKPGLGTVGSYDLVQRVIEGVVFLRACEDRGLEPRGQLRGLIDGPDSGRRLREVFERMDAQYAGGRGHFAPPAGVGGLESLPNVTDRLLKDVVTWVCAHAGDTPLPAEWLGLVYEQSVAVGRRRRGRKATGVYYTPARLVKHVVRHTLTPLLGEQPTTLRIVDPACGSGAFLLTAYDRLLDWWLRWYVATDPHSWASREEPPICRAVPPAARGQAATWCLTLRERSRILTNSVFGVDVDARAVETTRLALLLKLFDGGTPRAGVLKLPDLADNIRHGNALVGPDFAARQPAAGLTVPFDWHAGFPAVFTGRNPGFDAVIGNPPWGQKDIRKDPRLSAHLRAKFPSTKGIFDLFRPFVELAVRLCRPGGAVGQVLPDIVLLKNYEPTRRYLLEHVTLTTLDWWGTAFPAATIDTATIVGIKQAAPPGHCVRVAVNDPARPLIHRIPQAHFHKNERCTFNLLLTAERRRALERLASFPRLGDFFEVHEGVHSGNIRAELFVDRRTDDSCRELLFGRDELTPHVLRWRGRYIRLDAAPPKRTAARYANVGRPEWFERDKLLVRRTGDRVLAAVDRSRRYASNNFFVVLPRRPAALGLDGLCALLNTRFITRLFRTIEPRQGRAFAELKIKHLVAFPIPQPERDQAPCEALNRLGSARAALACQDGTCASTERPSRRVTDLDTRIEQLIERIFGFQDLPEAGPPRKTSPGRRRTPCT